MWSSLLGVTAMSRKLYVLIRHERAQPARRGKAWRSVLRLAGAAAATAVGGYLAWWAASAFCDGALFALIASWLIISVVALVSEALPFHLPAAFYEFRAFERSGAAYERLGSLSQRCRCSRVKSAPGG